MSETQHDEETVIQEFRYVVAIDPELEEAAAAEEAAIAAGVDPGVNHGAIARLKKVRAEYAELESRLPVMHIPVRRKRQ